MLDLPANSDAVAAATVYAAVSTTAAAAAWLDVALRLRLEIADEGTHPSPVFGAQSEFLRVLADTSAPPSDMMGESLGAVAALENASVSPSFAGIDADVASAAGVDSFADVSVDARGDDEVNVDAVSIYSLLIPCLAFVPCPT